MAYGSDLDREKLAVLATVSNMSQSEWIITMIRSKYAAAFGETTPNLVLRR
jgi:hypothetical protein